MSEMADYLACAMLKISLLVVDFEEMDDKSMRFSAKLDGCYSYQAIVPAAKVDEALKTQANGLESHLGKGGLV